MINLTVILPHRNLDIPERDIPEVPLNIDLIDYHLLSLIDAIKRKYPKSGDMGEGYTKTVKSLNVVMLKVEYPDEVFILSTLDPAIESARYDRNEYIRDAIGYAKHMCGIGHIDTNSMSLLRDVTGSMYQLGWYAEYDAYATLEDLEIDELADYPRFRVAIGAELDDAFSHGYEKTSTFQRTSLYENKDVLNSNYQLFISNRLVNWTGGMDQSTETITALRLAGVSDLDFTQAATVPGFYVFSANDSAVIMQMLIGFNLIKRGLFRE